MNNILENWEEGFREKVKDATYPAGGYSDQEQEIDEGELIEFIKELLQAQREKVGEELKAKLWNSPVIGLTDGEGKVTASMEMSYLLGLVNDITQKGNE